MSPFKNNGLKKKIIIIGLLFASQLLTLSCTKSSKYEEAIILKVNSSELTAKDFANLLVDRLQHYNLLSLNNPENINLAKTDVIKSFIIKSISNTWAGEQGIYIKKDDLEKEINALKASYPDDISFRKALIVENLSFNTWRSRLRNSLLQKEISRALMKDIKPPPEQELKTYYKNNRASFDRPEKVKIAQIVLSNESDAKLIREKLRKGKKLKDLAQFSIMPEKENSGVIGWVNRGDSDIFDKVFKLKKGRISEIIKSPYGFHIIKVLDYKRSHKIDYKKARKSIKNRFQLNKEQAIFSSWLDEQIRKSKVFKNDDLIEKIIVEAKGTI